MAAGVPVIPLKANDKKPVFDKPGRGCFTISPDEQWREVGGSQFRGNIGAILGEGIAVLDADSAQAVSSIDAWLDGSGLQVPTVKTVSDGRHYWLRVSSAPSDFYYKHLSREIGDGELRVSRSYVAVPCSAIGQKRYKFISGSPEALQSTRVITWQDLLKFVQPGAPGREFEALPVRLVRREMPARAYLLLDLLRDAQPGAPIDKYKSPSEAEAAVIAILILAGWQYEEIAEVFESAEPASFEAQSGKHRKQYFEHTWQNVLSELCNTPERIELAELYHQADEMAWPGRSGALNKATYKALLAVAWQFATFEPEVSGRVLAEHATASRKGIQNALERLEMLTLIDKSQAARGAYHAQKYLISYKLGSHKYKQLSRKVANSHSFNDKPAEAKGKNSKKSSTTKQERVHAKSHTWQTIEIFGTAALGRSAGLVYKCLSDEPKTIYRLADVTGKNWHTVKSALARLEEHQLAKCSDDGWLLGDGDLAAIADEYRARSKAIQRRERHERERERWQEILLERWRDRGE